MTRFYLIQGTISRREESGYTRCNQFPSFYLNAEIQGIVSPGHAEQIAAFVLNPLNDTKTEVRACAQAVDLCYPESL